MMHGARAQVFPDEAGEPRWRLVSANEEPVAQSESYDGGPSAAERGARDAATTMAQACGLSRESAEEFARHLRVEYMDTDGAFGFSNDELKGTAKTGPVGEGEPYPGGESGLREGGEG